MNGDLGKRETTLTKVISDKMQLRFKQFYELFAEEKIKACSVVFLKEGIPAGWSNVNNVFVAERTRKIRIIRLRSQTEARREYNNIVDSFFVYVMN
jgi:hypothetical protein